MNRNPRNIWKAFSPKAHRQLALAVALIFGVLGPIQILMRPNPPDYFWYRLLVLTAGSATIAGGIILFMVRGKIVTIFFILTIFWILTFSTKKIEGFLFAERVKSSSFTSTITGSELKAVQNRRLFTGILGILLLTTGYGMFIHVITREGGKRIKFQTERQIAKNIQTSLLPEPTYKNSWYEIAGLSIPNAEIGGDYYDIFELAEDKLAVVNADVSGHGTGAGILAAMTKSALHTLLHDADSPAHILHQLNNTIFEVSQKQMFITLAYFQIEKSSRTILFATAGHPPAYFYDSKNKSLKTLNTSGIGLGLTRDAAYESASLTFHPRDTLFLYTEGLLEAPNNAGEMFDNTRLQATFLKARKENAQAAWANILSAAKQFSEKETLTDDTTMLMVKL